MTGTPTYCAHCGRVTSHPHDGWSSAVGVPVIQPREPLKALDPTPQPEPMPLLPLIFAGAVMGLVILVFIMLIVK